MTEPDNLVPLLSVIIPSLEIDLELRRCIDSASLAIPKKEDCQIVLVVPPAAVAAATHEFPQVQVITETRPSLYGAMNDGAKAATGRYLYFVGKDDIVLPSIADALDTAVTHNLAAVFSDVYWGTRGISRGRTNRWQMLVVNVCHQGIIYSREAYELHGPYARRFRVRADHFFNIRLLWDLRTRDRILYCPTPIAWFSGSGVSANSFDWTFARAQPAIINRHLGPIAVCLWRLFKWLRFRISRGAPERQRVGGND